MPLNNHKIGRMLLAGAAALSFSLPMMSAPAQAATPDYQVPVGQVQPIEVPDGIDTFVIGDKKIAEIVVPPGQNKIALINAQSPGVTNLLIWSRRGSVPHNFLLEVTENRRSEQLAVRVQVLEVSSGNDGRVGIDWLFRDVAADGADASYLKLLEADANAPFKFGMPTRASYLQARINTLLNDRKAKMLAQPTLVTINGRTASFVSGGEIPVVSVDNQGRVNVNWKTYGVKLDLETKLEGADMIQMTLKPELSSIDRQNGVTTGNGVVVPALTTRRAEATVMVRENESVVVAGLLRDTQDEIINKFPLLGDIPFLGHAFRSVEFRKNRTELVFIVTPTIVKDPRKLPEAQYGQEAKELLNNKK